MNDLKRNDQILQTSLLALILFVGIIVFYLSIERRFDADEFDVIYAGSSFLRGKLFYSDALSTHFPFTDLSIALFTSILGMKTTTLIGIRIIFFAVLCATLYFVYQIGKIIRNSETGLIAVALTITSVAFVEKGIEIRHDVFNMFFNTTGVFFILQYFVRLKYRHLIIAAFSLGLALASTQKSIMWISGISLGFMILLIRKNGLNHWIKRSFIYLVVLLIPATLCFLLVIYHFNDDVNAILSQTIYKQFGYFFPNINKHYAVLPFPYPKVRMWKYLLLDNSLLYLTGIFTAALYLKRFNKLQLELIPLFWFLSGFIFYLFTKRPFYQNFLPTIPAFGLLCSFLLFDIKRHFKLNETHLKNIVYFLILFAFLLLPIKNIFKEASRVHNANHKKVPITVQPFNNNKHLDNLSFCLANLRSDDKVLCFTQQQVFFDPLLQFIHNACGETIRRIKKACLINLMKKERCRVVIFDYRTTHLKKNIAKEILKNYLYSGIGDIFIPGFQINPGQTIYKEIWISGNYSFTPNALEINGHLNNIGRMEFKSETYSFKNISEKPIYISYQFD